MTDDAMELTGRLAHDMRRPPEQPVRTQQAKVPSRVVQRRDAILSMLDAAYRRDLGGGDLGL